MNASATMRPLPPATSGQLLAWYDANARIMPWRTGPAQRAKGVCPDPYRVWLSEVMLQQTTVAVVRDYFVAFIMRWPTVADLAAADLDDVLQAWAGLGYYARARNLHACARAVAERHDGRFPETEEGLLTLPGVGAYTAAAIAAIAFDRRAVVVDGNVERVMARIFAVREPLPDSKAELKRLAATLTPDTRPGDHAQAVMDLGATICTPKKPACVLCPWRQSCRARVEGIEATLPARRTKAAKPQRTAVVFWGIGPGGAVLMQRRPEKGLLGGMTGLPSTPWDAGITTLRDALPHAPADAYWKALPGTVHHGFTHFDLDLTVVWGKVRDVTLEEPLWFHPPDFTGAALPSLMVKVARHALAALAGGSGKA